jgi:ubiquitin-protein ligase
MYPQTTLFKRTEFGEEFKVPLKMQHTEQPLHIKLILPNDFPNAKPIIQVMAQVTHPNVDSQNFQYKGAGVNSWNPNSSVATLIKVIHDDFTSSPPVP